MNCHRSYLTVGAGNELFRLHRIIGKGVLMCWFKEAYKEVVRGMYGM